MFSVELDDVVKQSILKELQEEKAEKVRMCVCEAVLQCSSL